MVPYLWPKYQLKSDWTVGAPPSSVLKGVSMDLSVGLPIEFGGFKNCAKSKLQLLKMRKHGFGSALKI
jgi:hypothetical protein